VQRYELFLNMQEFPRKKIRENFLRIAISRYFMLKSIK
jgi:hypothetical protein